MNAPQRRTSPPAASLFVAVLLVAASLAIAGVASAVEPEIRVEAGAEEIYFGEHVDYFVEIQNVKNPPAPDLSALRESFDVVAAGDESRNQSSTLIINGRVTQRSVLSHVYRYRLTPKPAGKSADKPAGEKPAENVRELSIPPVQVTVDGQTYTSVRLPLRVILPEEQDLVVVESEPSHTRVYPTQPFTVTLRVLVRPLPNDDGTDPLTPLRRRPPHLHVPWIDAPDGLSADDKVRWLQPFLAEEGVGFTLNDIQLRTNAFSFFDGPRAAVFDLQPSRLRRDDRAGRSVNYFRYELTRTFTPEKTGTYAFGPALAKGSFVSGLELRQYAARRLVAVASAVSVEVRDVPAPRPALYCGGIGAYTLTATAQPTRLRVGDPLTLSLAIERGPASGSLDRIAAPDLSAHATLVSDFELLDAQPTGRVEGTAKKFSYALRPKRAGVNLPPLSVATFNPQTEQFEEIAVAAIPLDVSAAERIAGGDLIGTRPSSGATGLKAAEHGIFQNITDPSAMRDERIDLVAWSAASLGVWCVAGVAMAIVTATRGRSVGTQRRQQARRVALRRLEEAGAGSAADTFRQVRTALLGLIADRFDRVAEGLTAADAVAILAAASVPEADCTEARQLLETLEAAEYGGGPASDPSATLKKATELVKRLS